MIQNPNVSSWNPPPQGPRVERHLLVKRARMQGFVLFDHRDRYDDALAQLRTWIAAGKLTSREDILEGLRKSLPHEVALENAPDSDGTFFKVPKVIER